MNKLLEKNAFVKVRDRRLCAYSLCSDDEDDDKEEACAGKKVPKGECTCMSFRLHVCLRILLACAELASPTSRRAFAWLCRAREEGTRHDSSPNVKNETL